MKATAAAANTVPVDATPAQIMARYIDDLNAAQARPIGAFLDDFPHLSASQRAQAERALYFLFASNPVFVQFRSKSLHDGGLPPTDPRLAEQAQRQIDREQDWLAWLGQAGKDAAAPGNQADSESLLAGQRASAADSAAFEQHLDWQLNYAHWLLLLNYVTEGLDFLAAIEADCARYNPASRAGILSFRLPYLYGRACLQNEDPLRAQNFLYEALSAVDSHSEDALRARDLLGVALAQAERPELAFIEHQQCLQAVRDGRVKDRYLLVSVYVNMADDLLALNEGRQALGYYQLALDELEDLNDDAARAAAILGLGRSYQSMGDQARAISYFRQAHGLYERGRHGVAAALVTLEIAACMIAQRRFESAERQLASVAALLTEHGAPLPLCRLYRHWAALNLHLGNVSQAAQQAQQSLDLARLAGDRPGAPAGQCTSPALGALAQAIHVVALVEERQSAFDSSDAHFTEALELIGRTGLLEVGARIARSYAEVLSARGVFAAAINYYRQALSCRHRAVAGN